MPAWLTPLLFIAIFAAFWSSILFIIGILAGWRTLGRHYRFRGEFTGILHRFSSGRLGASNYNRVLVLGASSEGLYLAVFVLFRAGHPPLLIPWGEVSVEPFKGWFFRYLDFRFAAVPAIRLRLLESLGKKLIRDANRSWAETDSDVN